MSGVDARRIAILPAAVADAIAAGEVVDRPAAVVKELMENAIDAGASLVTVRIEGAGRGLVEVIDDGAGMMPEDLALAFQRHATSKIASLDDLRAIRTLGFRGEALASIAAVAEVEAVTRAPGRGEGYRILVRGGTPEAQGVAGCPAGTRVSVRRLFFNTPARLRFLKQPATETAVIVRVVGDLALAHPEVAVHLDIEGRRAIETPGTANLREAFAALHDGDTAAAMLEVAAGAVSGLISPPSLSRATREHIVILVNRRRIHHRNLVFAVEQAYRGLKDPDRYPLAVLNLRSEPEDVDVNVHPTKREVRFRDEGAAFAAIERACFHALRQAPLYQLSAVAAGEGLHLRETAVMSPTVSVNATTQDISSVTPGQQRSRLPPLTYVGQLLNAYLVAEAPDAVVLVDQHAAHERVLFDRIWGRLERGAPGSQLLLEPQSVGVTPTQAAALERHDEWLRALGFEVEGFGHGALRLRAVPAELRDGAAEALLVRLLDDLDREKTPDTRRRASAALIACHAAVRFGDRMAPEAARVLLLDLSRTAEPIACPHGRPTTLVLGDDQLRRLFRRPA